MYEPFLGAVMMWAGSYVPDGWLPCDGRLMQVQQYQALYAVLGNQFGGTAPTTFALPDLRGRQPLGLNNGVPSRPVFGSPMGTFNDTAVTLTMANIPAHTHNAVATAVGGSISASATLNGVTSSGDQPGPGGHMLAVESSLGATMYSQVPSPAPAGTIVAMDARSISVQTSGYTPPSVSVTVGPAGAVTPSPIPITNYQVINFIIAVQGLFPPHP